MVIDNITANKIRGLFLKGFSKDEVASLLSLPLGEIDLIAADFNAKDLKLNSTDLYNELQKDLSKLVITELQKPNRDAAVVLNAIKLQAELQEKKLSLDKSNVTTIKVHKDYIYARDEKVNELFKQGLTKEQIAQQLSLSPASIEQSMDRFNLDLPNHLKTLSPAVITETAGLDKDTRLRFLQEAYDKDYTRQEMRGIVNSFNNETRT